MRYRIGELADFFGMTKEGVRYLERQGVIRSERDAGNGYRYYPRSEITRLKQIRRFQSLGFSLEEAQQMVGEVRRDEIQERLAHKQRELAEKARQIEQMQRLLMLQQEVAAHLLDPEHETIWLGERPELIFFARVPDEASGATPEEREAIAKARAEEKAWILAAPPCTLGAMHYARGRQRQARARLHRPRGIGAGGRAAGVGAHGAPDALPVRLRRGRGQGEAAARPLAADGLHARARSDHHGRCVWHLLAQLPLGGGGSLRNSRNLHSLCTK